MNGQRDLPGARMFDNIIQPFLHHPIHGQCQGLTQLTKPAGQIEAHVYTSQARTPGSDTMLQRRLQAQLIQTHRP